MPARFAFSRFPQVLFLMATLACSAFGGTETVLHHFRGKPSAFPAGSLVSDKDGNLYGTASGFNTICPPLCGTVFEMKRTSNGWQYHVLRVFKADSNGDIPFGGLVFDSACNHSGTTETGGKTCLTFKQGCGTVFELSPGSKGKW